MKPNNFSSQIWNTYPRTWKKLGCTFIALTLKISEDGHILMSILNIANPSKNSKRVCHIFESTRIGKRTTQKLDDVYIYTYHPLNIGRAAGILTQMKTVI